MRRSGGPSANRPARDRPAAECIPIRGSCRLPARRPNILRAPAARAGNLGFARSPRTGEANVQSLRQTATGGLPGRLGAVRVRLAASFRAYSPGANADLQTETGA